MESEAVRNAEEWFQLMIETGLAPGLRALGFSGSGSRYRLMVDSYLAQVAIQRSTTVDPGAGAGAIRFTLDASVSASAEWRDQLRIRPYLKSSGQPGWHRQIGSLVLVGNAVPIGDLWWQVESGRSFARVTREILTLVREFAIPAMYDQMHAAS